MGNKSKYPEDLNEKRPEGAEVMQPSKEELTRGIICKGDRVICNNCGRTLEVGEKAFVDCSQIDYHLCQNCKDKMGIKGKKLSCLKFSSIIESNLTSTGRSNAIKEMMFCWGLEWILKLRETIIEPYGIPMLNQGHKLAYLNSTEEWLKFVLNISEKDIDNYGK